MQLFQGYFIVVAVIFVKKTDARAKIHQCIIKELDIPNTIQIDRTVYNTNKNSCSFTALSLLENIFGSLDYKEFCQVLCDIH